MWKPRLQSFAMKPTVTIPALPPMINVCRSWWENDHICSSLQTAWWLSEAAPQRTISATTWSPVRRPVSIRDCRAVRWQCNHNSSPLITDGFPVSRGCKTKEKISVKTRDCENRIEEGTFRRVCYCRRRLCNIGKGLNRKCSSMALSNKIIDKSFKFVRVTRCRLYDIRDFQQDFIFFLISGWVYADSVEFRLRSSAGVDRRSEVPIQTRSLSQPLPPSLLSPVTDGTVLDGDVFVVLIFLDLDQKKGPQERHKNFLLIPSFVLWYVSCHVKTRNDFLCLLSLKSRIVLLVRTQRIPCFCR